MLVCVSASLLGDRLDTQTEKLWLGVLHGFLDLCMRKTDVCPTSLTVVAAC